EERRIFLCLLLPGFDAPVGDPAVEVLPKLLAEFGLVALEFENLSIGLEPVHHARIGRIRHAARPPPLAGRLDPIAEILAARLRLRRRGWGRERAGCEAH